MSQIRKNLTVFSMFVQESITYRSQAVLWMLTDIAPAIIMPFIWMAGFNGRSNIGGFERQDIILYYLTMTFLSNFVVAHVNWEIAFDVKQGDLSKYLLYPFSYKRYKYLGSLAWRLMRCVLFLPFALLWLIIFARDLGPEAFTQFHFGALFWLSLVLGHLVAYFIAFALGMLAFYFIETQSFFLLYYILLAVFSGQLAPYNLLPAALKSIAEWTPFRYTLSFPLEVLNGRVQGDALWYGLGAQVLWISLALVLGHLGWVRGTRRYAGTGL